MKKEIVLIPLSALLVACGAVVPAADILAIQTQAAQDVIATLTAQVPTVTATEAVPTNTPTLGPPTPTNTRVIPLSTPTAVPPTATPIPPTATPAPPTPTPIPPTPTPVPPTPMPIPPTPTPDLSWQCVETENKYHQAMLAYIEASYQPWIDFIKNEIERAVRERDARAVLDWQQELERAENAKAAEINAENARHEWAIEDCASQ